MAMRRLRTLQGSSNDMMRYRLGVALLARRFSLMERLRRRTVISWSAVLLVLSAAGCLLLGASSALYRTVEVTDIRPEIGLAYIGRLGDQSLASYGHPSPA